MLTLAEITHNLRGKSTTALIFFQLPVDFTSLRTCVVRWRARNQIIATGFVGEASYTVRVHIPSMA